MVGKHIIVIAAAGLNWEAAHTVCIDFADGFNLDVELP